MRVLAIDYGTKRMGIAISDEMGVIAQPLEFIGAEPYAPFLARLKEILREKQVQLVIVGMPRNMDGTYGPAASKVNQFIEALRQILTIPVKSWDERLTTRQAERLLIQAEVRRGKRRQKVDQTAAAILLQSYLDRVDAV